MKIRTKALLTIGFAVLVFAGVVVKDLRASQRAAGRMHGILKNTRLAQEVSPELKALMEEYPQAFRTQACIRKPPSAASCQAIRFLFENTWLARLRLVPRKIFSGVVVLADGRLVGASLGFGQPQAMVAVTENGDLEYFPHLPDDNPVFKNTKHFYFSAATLDSERSEALDWDIEFLTNLRTVQHGKELLRSGTQR